MVQKKQQDYLIHIQQKMPKLLVLILEDKVAALELNFTTLLILIAALFQLMLRFEIYQIKQLLSIVLCQPCLMCQLLLHDVVTLQGDAYTKTVRRQKVEQGIFTVASNRRCFRSFPYTCHDFMSIQQQKMLVGL